MCALCLPLQIYGSRVLGDFVLARPKKPLIWSSHLPESTLFVWSESVLGFGLTLFCVGLFLAPRGRAAYQELTLHTASIISFLDMAMSKQPRAYFTTLRHIFADTNSHLKLSLQHTHTPLSLLRCSHWKHTFSAAILWCAATCRICEACTSVFWISKWWNCDVKLKHYIFCTHTETHAPILAFAELRSYPWLSGAHCPHMMLHLWHVHVSLSVDISILHN